MKKTRQTPPIPRTLHLVSVLQVDAAAVEVTERTFEYEQRGTMLFAKNPRDGERDAPFGLQRIKHSELPCLGGLSGTSVAFLPEQREKALVRLDTALAVKRYAHSVNLEHATRNEKALKAFMKKHLRKPKKS